MLSDMSLAVDISLLAVLIALHATKKDKNMELVVMALLFSHIIMTTEFFTNGGADIINSNEADIINNDNIDQPSDPDQPSEEPTDDWDPLASTIGTRASSPHKSVSDGEFDRVEGTHTKSKTDLAKSRSSFFQTLFPNSMNKE